MSKIIFFFGWEPRVDVCKNTVLKLFVIWKFQIKISLGYSSNIWWTLKWKLVCLRDRVSIVIYLRFKLNYIILSKQDALLHFYEEIKK